MSWATMEIILRTHCAGYKDLCCLILDEGRPDSGDAVVRLDSIVLLQERLAYTECGRNDCSCAKSTKANQCADYKQQAIGEAPAKERVISRHTTSRHSRPPTS